MANIWILLLVFFNFTTLCQTASLAQVKKTIPEGRIVITGDYNEVLVTNYGIKENVLSEIQAKLDSLRKKDDALSKKIREFEGRISTLGTIQEKLYSMNKTIEKLTEKVEALDQETAKPESDYGLLFSKIGTSDYVIIRGMRSLNAMTLCFWMKTADQRSEAAPISYAASNVANNEILFINHKNFRLAIANEERTTSVSANDGKWHHICATWENTAGSWTFYKDGVMKASGSGFKKGHVIRAGGTLVLGQEQDTVGGTFDANQCFIGQLTGVNIWNRVVPRTEIFLMSKSCLSGEGNVFKWSEFKAHIQGGVEVIAPSSCSP